MRTGLQVLVVLVFFVFCIALTGCESQKGPKSFNTTEDAIITQNMSERDARMAWWREARFGMFIHWGLYAVPAGEWKGGKNYAEWILTNAQIPVDEYEKFAPQFNPVKFDAKQWVRMAKDAGMKYIVITSKHHDGFCLWDSNVTDYDVMDATPFKRDILKELTEECRRQGVTMCFYHSIMDWHHPDYLPRRGWEKRSAEGAQFSRYISYMKAQLAELIKNYGPLGVLWFDGEWEHTWTPDLGDDLYEYVLSLQPDIIVNNRVSKGRAGMAGTFDPEQFAGDFGTPEQEIPATGLGYDWETCMTMNNHWGWNKNDKNFKSTEDLIRKLIDIASKGGNFLLNVGPKADGTFPEESIERLAAIGKWMKVNGESIYGTTASLFTDITWGRCTTKANKLYLHVFDWPSDRKLNVPGLITKPERTYLLAKPGKKLEAVLGEGSVEITVPDQPVDPIATVVVMEFDRKPEVIKSPEIIAENDKFCGTIDVTLASSLDNVKIRYTLDGSKPVYHSPPYLGEPLKIKQTMTVKCQVWRNKKPLSGIVERTFTRVTPTPAMQDVAVESGVEYKYYEGNWDKMPDFEKLEAAASGVVKDFDIALRKQPEYYGFKFEGYIKVPRDGMYTFAVSSDDGSLLWINDKVVVNNDGLHSIAEETGSVALAAGLHRIRAEFFQKTGGADFYVAYSGPRLEKQKVPPSILYH